MNTDDNDFSQMSDRELIAELLRSQKKTEKTQKAVFAVVTGILVVCIIAFAVLVPRALQTVKGVDNMVKITDVLAKDAQESLKGINVMVENVNRVVVENTESVNDALKNFNEIDFEHLNQAIQDLANVIEPLSNFVNAFRR